MSNPILNLMPEIPDKADGASSRGSLFSRFAKRYGYAGLAAFLGSFLLTACETTVPTRPLGDQTLPPARVTLASGDVIKITFSGAPELSQSQKIRADGKISLPDVGEIVATGKSLGQLQAELMAGYQGILQNNNLVVTLESSVTRVYVSGAVSRPGPLTLDRPTTLLQTIMTAGGPTEFANMRRVKVIRLVKGRQQGQVIDMRPDLAGAATPPFYVRDGDIVSIPHTAF